MELVFRTRQRHRQQAQWAGAGRKCGYVLGAKKRRKANARSASTATPFDKKKQFHFRYLIRRQDFRSVKQAGSARLVAAKPESNSQGAVTGRHRKHQGDSEAVLIHMLEENYLR